MSIYSLNGVAENYKYAIYCVFCTVYPLFNGKKGDVED
jgi:hypothetical protein